MGGMLGGKTRMSRKDRRAPLARRLRREMTPGERKLWWHLREAQFAGSHFRRQAAFGGYFVDFCCHTSRLIIEVDGASHAGDRQMIADARRSEFLQARGYRVLRFWNNDVLSNIEGVMTVVAIALADGEDPRAPPLTLPAIR